MVVHLALKNKDNCSSAKVENIAIEKSACSKPQSYNTIVTGHTCLKKNRVLLMRKTETSNTRCTGVMLQRLVLSSRLKHPAGE